MGSGIASKEGLFQKKGWEIGLREQPVKELKKKKRKVLS